MSEEPGRQSNFRLEITLSIGYQRKRAAVEGVWEGHLTTAVLLIAGVAVVLLFLWNIFMWIGGHV